MLGSRKERSSRKEVFCNSMKTAREERGKKSGKREKQTKIKREAVKKIGECTCAAHP